MKNASRGASFDASATVSVGFEHVYVTSPDDDADTINARLAEGLHIVFTPAVYQLSSPLKITHPGTILLGLGLATLVSSLQNVRRMPKLSLLARARAARRPPYAICCMRILHM